MAEQHQQQPQRQTQQPQQQVQQTPAQISSQAMADAAAEAERLQLDEAGPGHHYLNAAGEKVDANGEPYKGDKNKEEQS